MNKEKQILCKLRQILNQKRNEYIDVMNEHETGSPYWNYCKGRKEMIEDIINFTSINM